MQTETLNNWTVATDEESQWLVTLGDLWTAHTMTGWQFVKELRRGIDRFGKRRDKTELYELVANQTGLATKTLMNYVSLARNENSPLAEELGLDIAHADAVRTLVYDEAEALLMQAAEQSLSADAVKAIIRERRQANTAAPDLIPDVGNERQAKTNFVSPYDDEPPFADKSSILYDDDYSAEANAYAGSANGYDWADDDDGMTYTIDEMYSLLQRAVNRLKDVDDGTQRTTVEWLRQIARHTY